MVIVTYNQNMMISKMLSSIELELERQIARLDQPRSRPLFDMLTYHMGWSEIKSENYTKGKRIRPLLVLLVCAACNSDWKPAVPAAAAIELIHNFSLLHDDIQDNSNIRHGRDSVWVKWGIPQAINAGDTLFVVANLALLDLAHAYPADVVIKTTKIFLNSCLDLTRGQYLDMSYEQNTSLVVDDYWPMVDGKTAALLSACCTLGSMLSNADDTTQEAYSEFGHFLGLAYQVKDDLLGIWGESVQTGKTSGSDLVSRKKSLPILFGIGNNGPFSQRWAKGPVEPEDVPGLSDQLIVEGARLYTQNIADQMTDLSLRSLRLADPKGVAGDELYNLVNKLLNRQS
jgi:geranylgeranyl diphosphate synthase type I